MAESNRNLVQHIHERRGERRHMEIQERTHQSNPVLYQEVQSAASASLQMDLYRKSVGRLIYNELKERDTRHNLTPRSKGLLSESAMAALE